MECVGHVQKHLGKKLREDLCGRQRSSPEVEVGGKGRLTNSVIDGLTVFYGGAIRNFPGDVEGMHRAI